MRTCVSVCVRACVRACMSECIVSVCVHALERVTRDFVSARCKRGVH